MLAYLEIKKLLCQYVAHSCILCISYSTQNILGVNETYIPIGTIINHELFVITPTSTNAVIGLACVTSRASCHYAISDFFFLYSDDPAKELYYPFFIDE